VLPIIPAVIHECIEGVDLNPAHYQTSPNSQIKLKNPIGNNKILYKSLRPNSLISVDFNDSLNSQVMVGENFAGSLEVVITKPNCFLYIGNDVKLRKLSIRIRKTQNKLFIGNQVTTGPSNLWLACSNHPDPDSRVMVIGDDCMFSINITLRTNDGHPIYDTNSWKEINLPSKGLIIEPHCWIGQGSTVLKNVTIGACSIVALGAVVTKTFPRFSAISGVPAIARDISDRLWSRGGEESKLLAFKYLKRYAAPNTYSDINKQKE
jgi:acetyltransferase-like isoleucine patch superfamily enzyme